MALMPGVTLDLLPLSDRMVRYDFLVIHTLVGWAPDGEEAHWTTNSAGKIVQRRDTKFQSAACYLGNPVCLAIENEDHGAPWFWTPASGEPVPPFTPEQCESIAEIAVFAHQEHGIPLELAPDSKPGSRGIAYHRQGIDGNFGGFDFGGRVDGGVKWSRAFGKVCPGDARIHQIIDVIIPRARVLAGLDKPKRKDTDVILYVKISSKNQANGAYGEAAISDGSFFNGVNYLNAKASLDRDGGTLIGLTDAEWDDRVRKSKALESLSTQIAALTAAMNKMGGTP